MIPQVLAVTLGPEPWSSSFRASPWEGSRSGLLVKSSSSQPGCPLTDEWIKKLYIYTMKYHSAIKRNEFESIELRQMDLQPVIQSEVNQKENKYHILTYIQDFKKMVLMNLFVGQG